jgi:hypothetical protein
MEDERKRLPTSGTRGEYITRTVWHIDILTPVSIVDTASESKVL